MSCVNVALIIKYIASYNQRSQGNAVPAVAKGILRAVQTNKMENSSFKSGHVIWQAKYLNTKFLNVPMCP